MNIERSSTSETGIPRCKTSPGKWVQTYDICMSQMWSFDLPGFFCKSFFKVSLWKRTYCCFAELRYRWFLSVKKYCCTSECREMKSNTHFHIPGSYLLKCTSIWEFMNVQSSLGRLVPCAFVEDVYRSPSELLSREESEMCYMIHIFCRRLIIWMIIEVLLRITFK